MDLSTMTSEERERYYQGEFSKVIEPLYLLDFPRESADHPLLAAEINAAYLRLTIFTIEVWMNYDPIAQRYYWDARIQDCGRPQLTPKQVAQCLTPFEFGKIRLEIRTPFQALATATFKFKPSSGAHEAPKARVWRRIAPTIEDDVFAANIQTTCLHICDKFQPSGRNGLNEEDVRALAREFLVEPNEEEYTWSGWLRDTETWMNLERGGEWNSGYVEGLED